MQLYDEVRYSLVLLFDSKKRGTSLRIYNLGLGLAAR